MIKVFPGGVGRVVLRRPAYRRRASFPPFGVGGDVFPFPNPVAVRRIWVTEPGQVRAYWYCHNYPEDLLFQLEGSLSGDASAGLHGGWLFNERVVPTLYDVTLL